MSRRDKDCGRGKKENVSSDLSDSEREPTLAQEVLQLIHVSNP